MEQFKTVKMNWFAYWIGHCWMTGWQSIRHNFRMWSDLMGSNYEGYALLKEDDPEAECLNWFWTSLVEDDVYSKEFLEYLQELCRRIETGEEKTYPMDLNKLFEIEKLYDINENDE